MFSESKSRLSQELTSLHNEEKQKRNQESIIDQITSHLKSSIMESKQSDVKKSLGIGNISGGGAYQLQDVRHLSQQEEPESGNKYSGFTISKSTYKNEGEENRNLENLRVQDLGSQQESLKSSNQSSEYIKEFTNQKQQEWQQRESIGAFKEQVFQYYPPKDQSEFYKQVNLRILTLVTLCKSLNPSESQKNTKFSLLKQTLGIQSDQKENEFDHTKFSAEELFQMLENQITALAQQYERKEDTRKEINEKMISTIKAQNSKDIQMVINEYEEKISRLKAQYEVNLMGMDQRISIDQQRIMEDNFRETEEIMMLNRENERCQETIQNLQSELQEVKGEIQLKVSNQRYTFEGELKQKYDKKKEKLKEKMKKKLLNIQQDEQKLSEKTIRDLKKRIDELEKDNKWLKGELDQKGKVDIGSQFEKIRMEEEQKYEKRISLVKKMHEEQLTEVKRVNQDREKELDDKLFQFNKQKEKLYQKAKEDALKDEKAKRQKFKSKLERINEQEIALIRREEKEAMAEMKQRLKEVMEMYNQMKDEYEQLKKDAIVFPSDPNQSFYPSKRETVILHESKGNSNSEFQSKANELLNKCSIKQSQNNSQSQNRLEKYKQKHGISSSSKKDSLNISQSLQNNMTLCEGKISKLIQNSAKKELLESKSFSFETYQQCPLNDESQGPKIQSINIQCDLADRQFEKFDYRVCLRCGKNDISSKNTCSFHPFKCHKKGGAGKLLYSQEWHKCREECNQEGSVSTGCIQYGEHYYGSHLPYEEKKQMQEKAQVREQAMKRMKNKEVMTDVSLMFNPFKSSIQSSARQSRREESQTQKHNESFRDSRSVSKEIIARTLHERSMSKSRDLGREKSPLSKRRDLVSKGSTIQANPQHHHIKRSSKVEIEEQKTSRLRISPFKDPRDSLASQSELSSKRQDSNYSKHYRTESAQGDSSPMIQSKYLKTEQQDKLADSKLSISALGKLDKSQKDWIKIEEYLTTSQRNY